MQSGGCKLEFLVLIFVQDVFEVYVVEVALVVERRGAKAFFSAERIDMYAPSIF